MLGGLPTLAAACLPFPGVASSTVEGDLVVADHRSDSPRAEPKLTLVVDEVRADDGGVGEPKADAVVEAYLVVEDAPAGARRCGAYLARLHGGDLGLVGGLFEDEVGDGDIVDRSPVSGLARPPAPPGGVGDCRRW